MTKCSKCGKEYNTYPIILDLNQISIACFLEMKEEYPNLCDSCFDEECEKY